jgi:exodeoxyribonuclease V beta subunit
VTAATVPPFDIGGPLPEGLVALEASAGTGKTYALAALAVRAVAERGVPASGLCVMSFTEAATAELRGRIRQRLVDAERHLAAGAPEVDDPVLEAVGRVDAASGRDEALARRLHRTRTAVRDIDAATISTIHGFCSRVSSGARPEQGAAAIADGARDVAEVVNDLVVARLSTEPDHLIVPAKLAQAVRTRLAMPDAVMTRPDLLASEDPKKQTERARRWWSRVAADLVDEAVDEVRARRVRTGRQTFDGLIHDTRELLRGAGSDALVAALRTRYQLVLVDEFQDTDRVQWEILRRAFVEPRPDLAVPPTTVVLVGDPKQAIYRFRSAELSAYLEAVAAAEARFTLAVNRRSDAAVLDGLESLFEGFTFGSEDVAFHPVEAAPGHEGQRLGGAGSAGVELRVVDPADAPDADAQRRLVRADVVRAVRDLLAGGVTVPSDDGAPRPLEAGDLAVLTASNADATSVALALGAAGVPAATASTNSVLDGEAGAQWRILLAALERPGSPGRARAAALGWFLGWSPEQLAALGDDELGDLHDLLHRWARRLTERGVAALLAEARAAGLHRRLLGETGGERHATDVDHIAELLQSATGGRPAGPTALLDALDALADPTGSGDDPAPEELARRLDRDDAAVQVLTVHRAKGLEFPVVLCPYLWTRPPNRQGAPHAHVGGRREIDATWVADVSDQLVWVKPLRNADREERRAESRRLLYVALTRARHRVVLWTVPERKAPHAALAELLANAAEIEPPVTAAAIEAVVDAAGEAVRLHRVDPAGARAHRATVHASGGPSAASPPSLRVATATRTYPDRWRIWSFTAVKAAAEERVGDGLAGPHPEPAPGPLASASAERSAAAVVGGEDEPSSPSPASVSSTGATSDVTSASWSASPAPPARLAVTTGLATAPGGTAFGTLVHRVLELVDFAGPDLTAELTERCAAALRSRPLPITADTLAAGLERAIHAPLGGPLDHLRLRDLDRRDRLDELAFDLPLGRLRADRIGEVLLDHLSPEDPFRPWAAALGRAGYEVDLEGMLTGSIDLVARTRRNGRPAYWLADHKTNRLDPGAAYGRDDLIAAMVHHDYPLQATLYLVALRRYLRWRDPGEPQVLGAAYLFLRGMDPERPAEDARGVLWWQPPTAAIDAIDRLLAGTTDGAPS